jgi:integrase
MRFVNPAEVARLADIIGPATAPWSCSAPTAGWHGELVGLRRGRVDLPQAVVEELAAHIGPVGPADAHVFTAEKGDVLRTSNFPVKVWLPAVRAAGLAPLRPHDLRHTAVALWIAAGANPKEVNVRAGHTPVAFTLDRYGHLFPGTRPSCAAARPPGRDARGRAGECGRWGSGGAVGGPVAAPARPTAKQATRRIRLGGGSELG